MVNDFNGVAIPKPASFDEYLHGYTGKPRGVIEARNKIGTQFLQRDDPRSLEELVKDHYCGIESNDEDIGAVLRALEEQGKLDETAIVWSSDHGFFLGEHRFYDKRLMYEPSIRIPRARTGCMSTTSIRGISRSNPAAAFAPNATSTSITAAPRDRRYIPLPADGSPQAGSHSGRVRRALNATCAVRAPTRA